MHEKTNHYTLLSVKQCIQPNSKLHTTYITKSSCTPAAQSQLAIIVFTEYRCALHSVINHHITYVKLNANETNLMFHSLHKHYYEKNAA